MRHFLTGVSKEIQRQASRTNHVFGARYKWSILRDARATAYVFKYVLRNPVRAGIVSDVRDYPYSSLPLDAARRLPLVESLAPLWSQVPKPDAKRMLWP